VSASSPVRMMSGARPTGGLHIGQYFAAFKPFVDSSLRDDNSFFVISDLHMLTTKFQKSSTDGLAHAVRRLVAEAIGLGIDPAVSTFYLQSQVPNQARIYAIIQSLAPITRLETQVSFGEMARHAPGTRPPTLGLLGYPILESSDVLSIGATHVTVGEANLGHFDLMREIVDELRSSWEIDIRVPEVVIGRANLVGLDGSEKMSKSAGNAIFFGDPPGAVFEKVAAMTIIGEHGVVVPAEYLRALGAPDDYCSEVEADVRVSGTMRESVRAELVERVLDLTDPVRARAAQLLEDPTHIDHLLTLGSARANEIAEVRYRSLASGVGLLQLGRQ